jgi:uncharacterized protein YcfL
MKKMLLLGCAAGLLAVTGCTTVNTIENAQKDGQRAMISDQRVITDASLGRGASLVGVNTVTTPGGLLKVQVELLNRTRTLTRFAYHFEWFDAQGMQVNNVLSATIADQLEGGESKFISGLAPHPGCQDFRVKFIETK